MESGVVHARVKAGHFVTTQSNVCLDITTTPTVDAATGTKARTITVTDGDIDSIPQN